LYFFITNKLSNPNEEGRCAVPKIVKKIKIAQKLIIQSSFSKFKGLLKKELIIT